MPGEILVKSAEQFYRQFDRDGKPKAPFTVVKDIFQPIKPQRIIRSMAGVTLGTGVIVDCPWWLKTLDGVVCQDYVVLRDCMSLQTLGNAVFGRECTLRDLTNVRDLGEPVFGYGCRLTGLTDPVTLPLPKLTAAEMRIVRQIVLDRLSLSVWHCGTSHCLAGWAEVISNPGRTYDDASNGGRTEHVGNALLPGLSHLFYARHAPEAVRLLIERLQALPVSQEELDLATGVKDVHCGV